MSQLEPTLDPTLELSLDALPRARRRLHVPGWLALVLAKPEGAARGRQWSASSWSWP